MRAFVIVLTLAVLSGLIQPAAAKPNAYVRMIETGEQISIAPDKAYALIRLQSRWKLFDMVLMRIPSSDEMARYEAAKQIAYAKVGKKAEAYDKFDFSYDGTPNLLSVPFKRDLILLPDGRLVLAELPAGEYVLYGVGYSGFLSQCFCLGTVRFTLKPGIVTDLGTIAIDYASTPASIPLLAPVSGLGSAAKMDYAVFAVGVRAAIDGDSIPTGLNHDQIEAAKYQAVGPYVDSKTQLISRLAPVEGVMTYKNGRVIDVPSGKELSGSE